MPPDPQRKPGLSWSTPKTDTAPVAVPPPARESAKVAPVAPVAAAEAPSPAANPLQTHAPVYAALLVSGIIIGVLLSSAWASVVGPDTPSVASVASSTPTSSKGVTTPAATSTTSSNTPVPLTVQDQPAGASVTIAKLAIAKPTWVVVYVNKGGKPGNALGARLFFAGDTKGKVTLLRNTAPGQTYFVGLSVDNGDRTFSLSKDKPLAGADGVLWATFKAR
jgi:hypothetical protein